MQKRYFLLTVAGPRRILTGFPVMPQRHPKFAYYKYMHEGNFVNVHNFKFNYKMRHRPTLKRVTAKATTSELTEHGRL